MNNREENLLNHLSDEEMRERVLEKFNVYHGWCTDCGEPSMVLAIRLGAREWGYLCSSCIDRMFDRYSDGFNIAIGPVNRSLPSNNNVGEFVSR